MDAQRALWRVTPPVGGLAIGIGTLFLTGLGLPAVAVVAAAMFVVSVRSTRRAFLMGYLLGFALAWAFLIVRMVANGPPHDNDAGWEVFGLSVVATGALVLIATRRRHQEVA